MEKRIHIITGHYGAGKSEISVNLAMSLSRNGKKVLLADMDTVNPYFRSSNAKDELERCGIKVIIPWFANTNVDVPALTGEFSRYLADKSYHVVMDVGGDDAGALVISRYRNEICGDEAVVYFAVNCFRPETSDISGVMKILDEIKSTSGMEISFLVNNSHLMDSTTHNDIKHGIEFIRELSNITTIPVAFHAVMKKTGFRADDVKEPVLWLTRTINFPDIA